MPDYKSMYLKMARATDKAIELLVQARQEAEEIYISERDPNIKLLVQKKDLDTTNPK